jgi:hypothetical protein
MSTTYSENKTHRANIAAAEGVRQASVSAAVGNQASVKSAELTFARTVFASAVANNCGTSTWTTMLAELGKFQS